MPDVDISCNNVCTVFCILSKLKLKPYLVYLLREDGLPFGGYLVSGRDKLAMTAKKTIQYCQTAWSLALDLPTLFLGGLHRSLPKKQHIAPSL
jgi:hypothetical protein